MIPVNQPLFISNEKKYLAKCIDSGWISSEGPFVKEFEEKFSSFIGKKYGIAVSSGTAALEVAVGAIGLKRGDEVIIPSFTIISCALAVITYGGIPVFVDSEPETWNMDVNQIERKITKKTKAIMPVHIYGHSCDMGPIMKIAKKHKLLVIEDAAESIPENIYLPVYSDTGTGIRILTFKELWDEQRKKNKPKKTQNGQAIFLPSGRVNALSYLNGGQWMPINAIYRHWHKGKIAKLNQKWGCVEATLNHSIYSANLELTTPLKNPELLIIRNINQHHKKYKKSNKTLLEVLAAYITEGNTTKNSRTYVVEIGQRNKNWLKRIGDLIKKEFGFNYCIIKGKRGYHLQVYRKDFFNFLIQNCGKYSDGKCFPDWIFDLDNEHKEFFWQKLLEGDGTKDGRYTTTSYKLANQISLLLTLLNKKFVVYERKPHKNKDKTSWNFRTERNTHKGLTQKKIQIIDYEGWVYDLEIERTHNFVCGLGNIVCHNTHGAEYKGEKCGRFGDVSCFSFYANKIINTGEGGMVLTNNKKYAERARMLRNLGHSKNKRFYHQELARNYRLTNLQAAVGVAQLKNIKKLVKIKRENARKYTGQLKDIKTLQLPIEKKWAKNVYWMYGIVLDESAGFTAQTFAKKLSGKGIDTRPFFYPLHLQPVFKKLNIKSEGKYPTAERIARQGLYLPSGLALKDWQIEKVCRVIRKLLI